MKKKIITIIFAIALVGVLSSIVLSGRKVFNFGKNSTSKPSITELSVVQPVENLPTQENIEKTETSSEEKKVDDITTEIEKSEVATKSSEKSEEEVPATTKKASSSDLKITDKLISWGFQNASNRKISAIILHSSYDAFGNDPYSVDGILKEYKDYGVSAHYLIDREGKVYRLVKDEDIAYHAGVSSLPNGEKNVNAVSIGIEIMNTKDGKFTDAQYDATNALISSIKDDYDIKYVLGHDQIAPGRKTDPWNMDWSRVKK